MGWLHEKTRSTASSSCGVPNAASTDENSAWCSGRYRAGLPDENTRIPEEFAALHEGLGQFQIGLFRKTLHRTNGLVGRGLYITVTRFGACGTDADGHQRIVARHEIEALADDRAEPLLVDHPVIGRRDDHLRFGIVFPQPVGGVGDGRRGIAADRLAENLFFADLGKDIADQFLVTSVGHHDEIFVGHQRREAFERMAQE